ncbi:MAG: hypothetical protein MAG795_00909 [Candidatus Woesearchaeota archaeon]|nr:hypothetical protein [Candidatus Woesearchaeota archaeon]
MKWEQVVDLHFHIGPEIIPRKYTADDLISEESGKLGGAVLKNHFFPTSQLIEQSKVKSDLILIGSVTLNNYVGGLNPSVIKGCAELSNRPILVWFPTISADNYLKKSKYEIRPEWVQDPDFKPRLSKNLSGIKVIREKKLTKQTLNVLETIKECSAILATGHISWQEAEILALKALDMGIKTIITHPIYKLIDMPIRVQKSLAQKGAFIEQTFAMNSIDKIPIQKIAQQIQYIGAKNCILSSDSGQKFGKSPSESLKECASLLKQEGITEKQLELMLIKNPTKIIKRFIKNKKDVK